MELVGLWCGARQEFIFIEELELWPPGDSIKIDKEVQDSANAHMHELVSKTSLMA